MIRVTTFDCNRLFGMRNSVPSEAMQDFFNEIGEENILHVTSSNVNNGLVMYTVVYRDNSSSDE